MPRSVGKTLYKTAESNYILQPNVIDLSAMAPLFFKEGLGEIL
jgi:hypothetical protein